MQNFGIDRAIKKFFLSAFVIVTFAAYVLQQQLANQGGKFATAPSTNQSARVQQVAEPLQATPMPPQNKLAVPGPYKDGTYTGPEVDAYYGLVQVQAVVQNGKISRIQFLDYPRDRRTSQEINFQVMPWLQQEAIQAQSANVDLISGATLTSEAFIQSLQTALQTARN